MIQQNFQLSGLTCSACQKVAANRLKKLPGVKDAKVESNGKAEIISENKISEEEVVKILADTPYRVISFAG